MIILAIAVYFLPLIIAACRRHGRTGAVAVVNIFLGWTGIGWLVALVWACAGTRTPLAVHVIHTERIVERIPSQPQLAVNQQ